MERFVIFFCPVHKVQYYSFELTITLIAVACGLNGSTFEATFTREKGKASGQGPVVLVYPSLTCGNETQLQSIVSFFGFGVNHCGGTGKWATLIQGHDWPGLDSGTRRHM